MTANRNLLVLAETAKDDGHAANDLAAALGIDVVKLTIRERCRTAAEVRAAIVREALALMSAEDS